MRVGSPEPGVLPLLIHQVHCSGRPEDTHVVLVKSAVCQFLVLAPKEGCPYFVRLVAEADAAYDSFWDDLL